MFHTLKFDFNPQIPTLNTLLSSLLILNASGLNNEPIGLPIVILRLYSRLS